MLSNPEAIDIFTRSGALMEGHFKLTSGRHSNRYMQCAQVLQYPQYTEQLAAHIAEKYADDKIDMVIGPAMGGIIVAYEVARQLKVPGIFCERENGQMALRRGFTIAPGSRLLVVEDVVTTGGSVNEVIEIVRAAGGEVAGVAVLVDRSAGKVDFGVRKEAVLTMDIESWLPDECPLCRDGQGEAIKPGSRS
ncbi:MAG TPA: orotate phosphoribosyltransferase [Syntrophomonadaceae bacterium]|jgi:orotate phosphoribosyltransferase|nr:orotate phosphoribosyltransferase [Syntrophomonadaceae bacterium]